MKDIKQFSPGLLASAGQSAATPTAEKSPYLKSVLTGSIVRTGRVVKMAVSDRLAAIRYIKESQWRSSFLRG